ncbi:MAG: hypothetical protein GY731_01810, partial [Gammaproteobacteria bacterium]|nr:hypothetical protein [Gammaproteobacteria bacterium]
MDKDKHALLVKAINVFNPDRPLSTADELEKYYVARLHAPLEKMSVYLRYSQQPVKLLFSGHMGSGKSTELARLSQGLQDKFLIVHVTRQDLNRTDLTYLDVLLVSAVRLFRAVFETGCSVKVDRDLTRDVFEWFSNEITQETTIRHDHAGGLVAQVNLLLFNLQKKFADEVSTRETIRERLYVRLKDMLDRVNALCAELEKHGWPPLILFEPSDKANREQGKELFFTHAQELILPECRMVYTFPIALCYTSEFGGFKDYYSKNFLLPNINVYQKEGNEPDI